MRKSKNEFSLQEALNQFLNESHILEPVLKEQIKYNWKHFAGDFVASFAAGYFDGLVPRRSNFFGQPEVDSSVDSAVKKGLASGALSTADRFREKLKKVPEFSEIKGPFNLKILILEQVKTTN